MKQYKVEVTWEMSGTMFVYGENEEDAISNADMGDFIDILHEERISEYSVKGYTLEEVED